MKRSSQPPRGHSLRLAVFFVFSVLLIVLISLAIRVGLVIRSSKYDSSHRFTITAPLGKGKAIIYSFDKSSSEVSILRVSNLSSEPVEKSVGILIDGSLPDEGIITRGGFLSTLPELLFFHKTYNGLTGYDVIRLAAMLRVTPPGNIKSDSLKLPSDSTQIHQIVTTLFTDDQIVKENKSIHIINATDTSGLGARLEQILTNSGANVIAIDTADASSEKSTVHYMGNLSYTTEKIASYLHVVPQRDDSLGLSDILIVIGKDQVAKGQF